MQLAFVVGRAHATIKHHTMSGCKLLVVQPLQVDGKTPDGDPQLAVDRLGAGAGETIVLTSDGRMVKDMLGDDTPVRWSVMGIHDA